MIRQQKQLPACSSTCNHVPTVLPLLQLVLLLHVAPLLLLLLLLLTFRLRSLSCAALWRASHARTGTWLMSWQSQAGPKRLATAS
jgi:hypothetical protein